MSLFNRNYDQGNQSLWWSYSASDVNSSPYKQNFTYFGGVNASTEYVEHRIDWLSDQVIEWRHSGTNDSSNFRKVVKNINSTNIPTMPAPVALRAWANGELSQSQGPPVFGPMVAHVMFTRFFYNSSTPERQLAFENECQLAAAQSTAICSTEDFRLRDSTPFDFLQMERVKPIKVIFKAPLWGVILESTFAGLFVLLLIHGLFVRRLKAIAKAKAGVDKYIAMDDMTNSKSSQDGGTSIYEQDFDAASVYFADPFRPATPVAEFHKSSDKLMRMSEDIAVPELWDDDEDFDTDEEAELDNVEEGFGDIEGGVRALEPQEQRMSLSLPSFGASSKHLPPGFATPQAIITPDDRAEQLRRWTRSTGTSSGYFAPALSTTSLGPTDKDSEFYAQSNVSRWSQKLRKPQILRWRKRAADGEDAVGALAQPVAADNFDRRPSVMFVQQSLFEVFFRKFRNLIFIQGAAMKTSTGESRIDYLDGMRGFACLFVSLGHFILIFYYGIADPTGPMHYRAMEIGVRAAVGGIIVNAGLVLGIFFVLPSRTMCMRYLLKGGLQSMADSTVRRLPRLIIPVLGAAIANYFMMDINAYYWVPRLSSRTWSIWSYWQNYKNVGTFINAVLTIWWAAPPVSPALVTGYATGVLWTIPVIVQGMWTCTLSALVAHEIKKPWKRFSFYALCTIFSWYANSWDMFFMEGLIVADLDANLHYRKIAALGFPLIPRNIGRAFRIPEGIQKRLRIKLSILAWIFFLACCVQQWLYYLPLGTPGDNVDLLDYGIHPDWKTSNPRIRDGAVAFAYSNPKTGSWFLIMAVFILVDLSWPVQQFFRLRIWSFLGKHSMAFFLLHGIIFWTWGAWLTLYMSVRGVPYWAIILTVFITAYILLCAFCIAFTGEFLSVFLLLFIRAGC